MWQKTRKGVIKLSLLIVATLILLCIIKYYFDKEMSINIKRGVEENENDKKE